MNIMSLDKFPESLFLKQVVELEELIIGNANGLCWNDRWDRDNYKCSLPLKKEFSFVIVENFVLLGFSIGYQYKPGWAHISRIGVHPKIKGKGYGLRLIYEQSAKILTYPMEIITIETITGNVAALKAYSKIGFNKLAGNSLALYLKIRNRETSRYIGGQEAHSVLVKIEGDLDLEWYFGEFFSDMKD